MGLGLLILTTVGKENIYISTNPEITYFKIVYKRYTNFSIEAIPQFFKTTPDFGRKCSVIISKNADLLGMTYLYVELPYINNELNFKWVDKIGYALINNIEIEIEGSIIDKHYGDWLNIWYELTKNHGHNKSYDNIIGNKEQLINYSNKKSSDILYIPLCFWFCLDTGLALPLISIINSDIKINVEFNEFNLCYKVSPYNYITINENICCYEPGEKLLYNNIIIGEFVNFDIINQRINYNPLRNITFTDNIIIKGMNSLLEVSLKNNIITQNTNNLQYNPPSLINSYLLVNYIYIDNFERVNFINKSHEYIIPVIQTLPEKIINSVNNIYKLPLYNPIKLLVWRCILVSNLSPGINDLFNYGDNLINNNLVVINSINRMELNSIIYYTNLQKYQYDFNSIQNGIYMYSFGLYPKDIQPSGCLNFSKIDDAYIKLTMNTNINYQNPVSFCCYAIQYNLFKISNGIGGINFNN
jgi:hypothetical protein